MKISVNGLAKFILGSPATQRRILRDFKFPNFPNGARKPQIVRYSEARAGIKKYHESGNDKSILVKAVADLAMKRAENPEKDAARINDNIRAIESYMKYFSENNFEVLQTPRPIYARNDVLVSAMPDLYVSENGTRKLIKLDFNQGKPNPDAVSIIVKVMHEASAQAELGVKPKDVIYLDVSRRAQYNGSKLNKRLKNDIDAACDTIHDMWPNIKQQ